MSEKFEGNCPQDFVATIKNPDLVEAARIINAQARHPNREITCYLNPTSEDPDGSLELIPSTRIPYRHRIYGMEKELNELAEEMRTAAMVQISNLPHKED